MTEKLPSIMRLLKSGIVMKMKFMIIPQTNTNIVADKKQKKMGNMRLNLFYLFPIKPIPKMKLPGDLHIYI
jgi:hypothetical protein